MKGSSKPISSPGRTGEKFPPPLMRFLKSKSGSRSSRGRTIRASPIFMWKNNNNNKNHVAIEAIQQEPSSPKVTCIGQVRARRSSKSAPGRNGSRTRRSSSTRKQQQKKKLPCRCCCNLELKLHRPKSLISVLKKWVCCFRFEHCGKKVDSSSRVLESTQHRVQSRVSTSSSTTESTAAVKIGIFESGIEDVDGFVVDCSNSIPPVPKNALILTRCRSAPYRSSSLASRFWGSPLNHHSDDNTKSSQSPPKIIRELEEDEEEEEEKRLPVLENPINGDIGSIKSHESEEMQSSIKDEEEKNGGGDYVHPLLLTRCKSEPARAGERLNPRRFSESDPQS